ncbi:MAG: fibronectin type III domain-containing protein, partial [Bacteroidota bacterium]
MQQLKRWQFFALFLCLGSYLSYGQSTINITTSGGSFPGEKWVSITTGVDGSGTQIWGQGDGTYSNGSGLINQDIMIAPGTYYVNCYDQYSDGWDGTLISVTAYGQVIGDNGGVSPSDPSTTDATSSWDTGAPETELEASFQIIVPSPPSCFSPTSPTNDAITTTTANFSWMASSSTPTSGYDWIVVDAGESPTGTIRSMGNESGTSTTVNSGLSSNTSYSFYVKAN